MKILLAAASLAFIEMTVAPAVLADSMKCKVLAGLEANETGELKVEYKQVAADRWITSSVDLVVISAEASTTRLFDAMTRGGYEVSYCNPNDNEYSTFSSTFSLFSNCTAKAPIAKVIFHSSLSKTKKGFLEFNLFYENGESGARKIEVGICE